MRALALTAAIALVAGCAREGVDRASGLEGNLSAMPGQWLSGTPAEDPAGPSVSTIDSFNNAAYPGVKGKSISGLLAPGSVAVGIGLEGDPGYWVVPAGPEDLNVPTYLTFSAKLSLSALTPPGSRDLRFWAIDAAGRAGPARALTLLVSDPAPQGALVISLTWDTLADLDLRVVQPDGTEIGSKTASRVDRDSNAGCDLDGWNQEDAAWDSAPPSGRYTVRVNTFSLCGQATARWQVRVLLDGVEIGRARGQSLPSDTAYSQKAAAGTLALEFEVP
jgi:hypothetical protein